MKPGDTHRAWQDLYTLWKSFYSETLDSS